MDNSKRIFLIIWKTWKSYKIKMFYSTKAAWEYVHKNNVESYSVYWSNQSIDHSKKGPSI